MDHESAKVLVYVIITVFFFGASCAVGFFFLREIGEIKVRLQELEDKIKANLESLKEKL